jgi:hypothetical protein
MKYYLLVFTLSLVQQHFGLSCEKLRMAGLDDCSILQPKHLVGYMLGGMHATISVQNLISPE